jgi:hypothetical protein
MNIRTPLIRAAVAAVLIGGIYALPRTPHAAAAHASVTMSVDRTAPLHATLLPTLSVTADASAPDLEIAARLADVDALPVTLLPTVHVHARRSDFASAAEPMLHRLAMLDYAHGALIARIEAID